MNTHKVDCCSGPDTVGGGRCRCPVAVQSIARASGNQRAQALLRGSMANVVVAAKPGGRVLVIDDEPLLRATLQQILGDEGYIVDVASDGAAGLVRAQQFRPDVILLDLMMPTMNGKQFLQALRAEPGCVNLPVLIMTAVQGITTNLALLGVGEVLEKPFDAERLYASLDKALQYIDETYIDLFLYNSGEDKKILVDDIMYIRRENRKIILHTKDGNEYITRRNLNEWMEELPNTFFYLVHKSFLVNLHYITKNSYSIIVLDNTIQIPVASRKQVDFHKYWFQYLKRR